MREASISTIIILMATIAAVVYYVERQRGGATDAPKKHADYLKRIKIKNAYMSYVDTGGSSDKIVVFLHGNPTSSYLWRNIYPNIAPLSRCYAPDLIGMGASDKVPGIMYTFAEQYEYLSEWIEKIVGNRKVNLVLHDWGSGLGFHWAKEHREQVESIVHMESIYTVGTEDTFQETGGDIFKRFRTDEGEKLILEQNYFVDYLFPGMILRNLTEEEMNEYRRPFLNPGEDRRPTLTWPRQIPVRGDGPDDVIEIVDSYYNWLINSASIPKLAIIASPGLITPTIDYIKDWPNQEFAYVKGIHFIQEDSPVEISAEIFRFLMKVFSRPKHDDYRKKIEINGANMSYIDTGGDFDNAFIFLHGNPTSSYLWRNIYPTAAQFGRCFAPDLIGMGHSDKLVNSSYRFVVHYDYLSKWIESVVLPHYNKVNLIIHDWGSGLGFHWANLNRGKVMSIVHFESVVAPTEGYEEFGPETRELFRMIRSPAGEQLVLDQNIFLGVVFQTGFLRNLTDEEVTEYRRPYLKREDRMPLLVWPREIPIRGDGPDDVIAFAQSYYDWLSQSSDLPKLLIIVEPGVLTPMIVKKTKDWPNQATATVRGLHFAQEDSPSAISDIIYEFMKDKVFVD